MSRPCARPHSHVLLSSTPLQGPAPTVPCGTRCPRGPSPEQRGRRGPPASRGRSSPVSAGGDGGRKSRPGAPEGVARKSLPGAVSSSGARRRLATWPQHPASAARCPPACSPPRPPTWGQRAVASGYCRRWTRSTPRTRWNGARWTAAGTCWRAAHTSCRSRRTRCAAPPSGVCQGAGAPEPGSCAGRGLGKGRVRLQRAERPRGQASPVCSGGSGRDKVLCGVSG